MVAAPAQPRRDQTNLAFFVRLDQVEVEVLAFK